LVDKRAIANEALYKKLEDSQEKFIRKLDFQKLYEENKTIVEEIGECSLSVCNTIEAMQDSDCMCIGLKITRTEGTIGDPSLLQIHDIYPTFMTIESFLQSAKFNLEENGLAHGAFKNDQGGDGAHLALGLGREDITGILPLYLF